MSGPQPDIDAATAASPATPAPGTPRQGAAPQQGTAPQLPDAAHLRRNLLPGMHAPMRTFMVAVVVMVYLATLAAAAVMLVRLATAEWTAGVVSEATAQVLPRNDEAPEQLQARARKVADLLAGLPGVRGAWVLSEEENRALLRPWLGRTGLSLDLPLPALVAIKLQRDKPASAEALRRALQQAGMADVEVDAHGRWIRELSDLSRMALWLGMAVLALLLAALVVLVVHAARAALQANRSTLEVLHLIGAQDRFIARQVERHFLRAAFLAALGGALAALATLLLLALLGPSSGIGQSILNLLFLAGRDTVQAYVFWLLIVVMTTLVSLTTARVSAMRILGEMFRAG